MSSAHPTAGCATAKPTPSPPLAARCPLAAPFSSPPPLPPTAYGEGHSSLACHILLPLRLACYSWASLAPLARLVCAYCAPSSCLPRVCLTPPSCLPLARPARTSRRLRRCILHAYTAATTRPPNANHACFHSVARAHSASRVQRAYLAVTSAAVSSCGRQRFRSREHLPTRGARSGVWLRTWRAGIAQ